MEIDLDPKYQALLEEAERQDLADQDSMRVCAQTLTLAAMIDRRRAAAPAPPGLAGGALEHRRSTLSIDLPRGPPQQEAS